MNRDEMIEYYLSLMPNDLFNDGLLKKDDVIKRLNKLSTEEIAWEIKDAENSIDLTTNWD